VITTAQAVTQASTTFSQTSISNTSTTRISSRSTPTATSIGGSQLHKSNARDYAGVAIGCLIGGAVLAGIACFLWFQRYTRRLRAEGVSDPVASQSISVAYKESGRDPILITPGQKSQGIEAYQQQPAGTSTVTGDMSNKKDTINDIPHGPPHTQGMEQSDMDESNV
jgi:hypothetical protein